MEQYKYTYQNWLKGEIKPETLIDLVKSNLISSDDYHTIRKDQSRVYLIHASLNFLRKKIAFLYRYERTLAKEELLNTHIDLEEKALKNFKETYPSVYIEALNGMDNRYKLGPKDILFHIILCSAPKKDLNKDGPIDLDEGTHIDYYAKSHFLKWLKWFKEDGSKDNEPEITIPYEDSNEEILQKLSKLNEEEFREFFFDKLDQKDSILIEWEQQYLSTYDTIAELKGNGIKEEKKSITFIWNGKPEEIDTLFNQLIKGGYLPANTDKENFKALFSGKHLDSIKPLQWLKSSSLLAYFIDQLNMMGKFPDDTHHWKIAEACFAGDKNLRQKRNNYIKYNKCEKPKGYRKLDDNILKYLD